MNSVGMAELMVKLERDCETACENLANQFHIRSEWRGENKVSLSEVNELNVHFNRRYPLYAITIIANNGTLDNGEQGSALVLVGHRVIDPALPDIYHKIYENAPPHLK